MVSKSALDLKGVISPLDLLKCKTCLKSMKAGDVLEVLLADKDVVRALVTIIHRSNDQLLYEKQTSNGILLGIKRGKPKIDSI